uniref:Uncharacterized protein n=1 Tax=Avena sativa TaxID=4498 RepID=A0ACD6AFX5_AVESA
MSLPSILVLMLSIHVLRCRLGLLRFICSCRSCPVRSRRPRLNSRPRNDTRRSNKNLAPGQGPVPGQRTGAPPYALFVISQSVGHDTTLRAKAAAPSPSHHAVAVFLALLPLLELARSRLRHAGLEQGRPSMHQIGSGMYVSGRAPDRKRERQLSSGSVATPPYTGGDVSRSGELGRMFDVSSSPASSSRRSSGPLQPPPLRPPPSPALSHSGLLVGPSPLPSPARGGGSSSRKASRMRAAAGEESAPAPVVARGRAKLGVPLACYVLVALAAAAGLGAGAFFLVSWRRWEPLAAAGAAVAAAAAVLSWNAARCAAEAERFFRASPDTAFDQADMPIGELVKITGQVTCGRVPVGACFHDAARCVFTSVRMYGRRGWAGACCCSRWQLRHSEARSTSFYISDRNSGRRFYVRAGEATKITWMIKRKTVSFDGDTKAASRSLKSWTESRGVSCDGGAVRVEEGFIREGDTASVIGVLKKHHAYDVVDAPEGVVSTGFQPARCMFPVLVEGLVLIGSEDPDDDVYMV